MASSNHKRNPMLLVPVRTVALLMALGASIAGAAPPAATTDEKKVLAAEAEQRRLHRNLSEKVDALPDSARKEELLRQLADIERRIAAQGRGTAYLSPGSKFTPEMRAYHERLTRKIEDCGSRHMLRKDGKSVYGKGTATIRIDRSGRVVDVEVLESSRDKALDRHMQRVVRASAPFGPLPDKLTTDSARQVDQAVIVTRFAFTQDDEPVALLPERESCRWQ